MCFELRQVIPPSELPPPLKWAGGKRWLVPHLLPLWEQYAAQTDSPRLVEPFCGGLAVALGLAPENAILNDINPHLINFYRQLQRGLVAEIDMVNDPDVYYRHRERFNALIRAGKAETPEAAALFYYLNRTGFNGLCRFNKAGEFNVPFGRYTKITYTHDFSRYRDSLAGWAFRIGPFTDLPARPTDFIYADPPYDVEFTQYAAGGFHWADQVALAEWLAAQPGTVVLSNQATERIIDLYSRLGFRLTFYQSPRRISANGNRTPAREVLALKGL